MKTSWSPTSRAKPISWVTTTMVMPSRARSRITSSTSPTSSGSSAEVGSSKSISFGRIASARAIATRCCWPPDSWLGYASAFVGQPDPLQQRPGPLVHLLLRLPLHPQRRLHHVAERGHVREQVEVLEDHPDVDALLGDLGLAQLVELVAALPVADQHAVHPQPAGVDLLQVVDAAQERRLARAGRPDDAHHLAALDRQVDALEHLEPAEALVHALGQHHRRPSPPVDVAPPRPARRSRRSAPAGRAAPPGPVPPPSRRRSFCSGVSGSARWLPRA